MYVWKYFVHQDMLYKFKVLLKQFKVMKSYIRRISTIELYNADFSHNVFKCVLTDMVNGLPWNKGRIYIQNIVSIFLFSHDTS